MSFVQQLNVPFSPLMQCNPVILDILLPNSWENFASVSFNVNFNVNCGSGGSRIFRGVTLVNRRELRGSYPVNEWLFWDGLQWRLVAKVRSWSTLSLVSSIAWDTILWNIFSLSGKSLTSHPSHPCIRLCMDLYSAEQNHWNNTFST